MLNTVVGEEFLLVFSVQTDEEQEEVIKGLSGGNTKGGMKRMIEKMTRNESRIQ